MNKIIAMVIVLIVLAVSFSGCLNPSEIVNPPKFVIMSKQNSEDIEGFDKVGYVEVVVKNTGGDGAKIIIVGVKQGDNYIAKEQSVYLLEGESKTLSFRFQEIGFWTLDSWTSAVKVVQK